MQVAAQGFEAPPEHPAAAEPKKLDDPNGWWACRQRHQQMEG
jgi:hypothetical protein